MNPLVSALNTISPLSQEALAVLNSAVSTHSFKRNSHMLEIGSIAKNMFFIEKGIARAYYLHDGNDVTDYFATEYQFIGAVESLFTGMPSLKGLQALEESTLHVLPYAEYERLCTLYHDIERTGRKVAIYGMLEEQRRIESVRFHDAKKRYADLNAKYPGITNRCPLKHIASYLGITQVSLSRLRAEA